MKALPACIAFHLAWVPSGRTASAQVTSFRGKHFPNSQLVPNFCPFTASFLGEGSPTKIDYRKKGYPYSKLSTGGPSCYTAYNAAVPPGIPCDDQQTKVQLNLACTTEMPKSTGQGVKQLCHVYPRCSENRCRYDPPCPGQSAQEPLIWAWVKIQIAPQ